MIKRLGIRNIATLLNPLWDLIVNVWNGDSPYNVTTLNTNLFAAWNGDNDVNDSLGNYNGVNNNVSYTTGKIGAGALSFNGSNSYVALPQTALNFNKGNGGGFSIGDFSVSFWVNLNAGGSGFQTFITNWGDNGYGWQVVLYNGGLFFFGSDGSNGATARVQHSIPLSQANATNQWVHVAVTYTDKSQVKSYVNGVLVATTNTTYEIRTNSRNNGALGAWPQSGANTGAKNWYLNGNLDAVNIWDKVLSDAEVNALYNSGTGLQQPFPSSVKGLLASSNDLIGSSNGSLTNGTTITNGKLGSAFTFDGINDYITLPTNSILLNKFSVSSLGSVVGQYETYGRPAIGATAFDSANDYLGVDYSISLWVYLTDVTSSQMIIGSYDGSGTGYNYGWGMWVSGGASTIGQYEYYGSGQYNANAPITANAWHHVVATRKAPLKSGADNGTIKLYIDGVLVATTNPPTNHSIRMNQFPALSTIGCSRWGGGNANYFMKNGSKLDAITIWEREITSTEVTELYNGGNGKQYAPVS